VLSQRPDVSGKVWTNELGLEANQDVNLGGVLSLQTLCLDEISLMTRGESLESGLRVIKLRNCETFPKHMVLSHSPLRDTDLAAHSGAYAP
jgi:hypothetical protein